MDKQAENLLKFIKYSPFFAIFLASTLLITLTYQEQNIEFKKEKLFIEEQYIKNEKERIRQTILTIYKYIKKEEQKSIIKLKSELKRKMDIVHNISTNLYNKYKNTLSREEIIDLIKNVVETLRYNNGNGYFSIHTTKGINILHPIFPEFEGTNVINRQDSRGNYSVQQAIKIANEKGEGFLNWYYYKPNDRSKEFKKIGIIKKFEPYNLIITTAIFIDDYKKKLQGNILDYLKNIRYKDDGFPFIIQYNGDVILHPSQLILNHNIFKEQDFHQVSSFYKNFLLDKNNQDGRFITIKPTITNGKNTKDFKISYIRKFDEWKWFLGTGFNLVKANEIIKQKKVVLLHKYNTYIKNILFYGILLTIILLIISFFIANFIENKFLDYRKRQDDLNFKELKSKDDLLNIKDEFNNFFELSINLQLICTIEGKINQINDSSNSILGYKKEELINTSFIDLIHPDDIDKTRKEMSKLENGEDVSFFENRYIHKNGTFIHLAWSATANKKNQLIYATAQNITEAKLLLLDKKEKEKIIYQQNKMASMGQMLGNIAHQWRQPLNALGLTIQKIKLYHKEDILTEENLNKAIKKSTILLNKMSTTIDDFMNFYKVGKTKKSFCIRNAIDNTVSLIDTSLINSKITIDIIDNQDKRYIIGYQNELEHVLLNIIHNAKDALLHSKVLNAVIKIEITSTKDTSLINIYDNAGGIDQNILEQIFDPYFTTKEQGKGTGLGLYMSKMIIENSMNGELYVTNYKEGSCFTIKLS